MQYTIYIHRKMIKTHQSLSQHFTVELLEHVLVLNVLEHHHHLKIGFEIPDSTNLWVRIVT